MTPPIPSPLKGVAESIARHMTERPELYDRRAAILEARLQAAQAATQRDGGYYPDELPFGAELADVSKQIKALEPVTA